jgi:hypothetical protein
MQPFNIIKDRGFQCLMKTGRPGLYIPSPMTISHDVKEVFIRSRQRISKMLRVRHDPSTCTNYSIDLTFFFESYQQYKGKLNFATDAWTSPNHKAYLAVTVHFEQNGIPVLMLLDIVHVATSHSGINLAAAFAKILDDFGISDKVRGTTELELYLTTINY